jgi:hypothetical protein
MNDINTAVFVGLSLANIPPASWDLQIFANHARHAGTVTTHPAVGLDGDVATLSFTITDGAASHAIVGTLNWTSGASTFSVDGTAESAPSGYPQIEAGIQVAGSQVWFRYNDATGILREYRFHTNTNPRILQDALNAVDKLSPLAGTIAKWLLV